MAKPAIDMGPSKEFMSKFKMKSPNKNMQDKKKMKKSKLAMMFKKKTDDGDE